MGPPGRKACVTDELCSCVRAHRVAHCQQRALMVGEVQIGGDQGEQRRESKPAQDSLHVRCRSSLRHCLLTCAGAEHFERPQTGHECSRTGSPRQQHVRAGLQESTDSPRGRAHGMPLMWQGAPGGRVVHIGQAENEEPPEGAHIDIQLGPGGGLEGVDALPPASEDTSLGPLASFTATHGLGLNHLSQRHMA